jgi:UDP-N-acetylmuramoyl-tripeptide--D-alanyl-D-alanine ligase
LDKKVPIIETRTFAEWVSGEPRALPPTVCGVTQDTRKLTPGCLYVALRGERFDGHDYVGQALRAGAAAALVETSWQMPAEAEAWPLIRVRDTRQALSEAARAWRRQSRAFILGVTGSSGKTTTKEMAAALFAAGGAVCATQGNLNNEIGLPLCLLAMPSDTAFGIFEVGTNHPGEIARLAEVLQPRAALVSSIGCAHIEHFGSLEAIAREKGAFLSALPRSGFAVLCKEMEFFGLLSELSNAPVVTTSLVSSDADFRGDVLDPMSGAIRVAERATGVQTVLRSGLPGEHNAANLLLAFAAARSVGVPAQAAAQALLNLSLPGMRWDVSTAGGVTYVNDAYNANPQSMVAVLRTFMKLPCSGRRIVVLGDMLELGLHAEALHRDVGRCVAELSPDGLMAVGADTGRYAVDEALKAGFAPSRVRCFADARAASAAMKKFFKPGDCVLLKASRGMRLERILDDVQV